MSQNKSIIFAGAVFLIACVCLILVGGVGVGLSLPNTLATAVTGQQNNVTSTEIYQPPQRPTSRGRLLLDDDFSHELWKSHHDSEHRKGYANGQYFIAVDAPEYSFWSVAGESYSDFVLEVDTLQINGPDDNDYGVILRYQDDGNFYSFEISSDGFYTFNKLANNQLYEIIPWQQSDAIKPGDQGNALRVEAIGPNFTFYINDALVDTAIDSDFEQGDVGLIAGTYQDKGTHIAFDNLKVWATE